MLKTGTYHPCSLIVNVPAHFLSLQACKDLVFSGLLKYVHTHTHTSVGRMTVYTERYQQCGDRIESQGK